MAKIKFGGVVEDVVTREEFPLERAREILKNETIGNSKTNPAASITLMIMFIYSSMANWFFIASEPNCSANFNAIGSIIKYANAIPLRKQKDEKITIERIYFFSFFLSAGEINFHSW